MSDYISKSELIEELEKVHPRVNGVDVFWSAMKVVENQPTLDEKEIIRNAFERVVERLEEFTEQTYYKSVEGDVQAGERNKAYHKAISVVKEVGGLNESN